MSDHDPTTKSPFIMRALLGALVFLLPTALHSSFGDVSSLKKEVLWRSQAPGLQPVTKYGSFFGLKLTLKPEMGWNSFSGGDIEKGIAAFYDSAYADVTASGARLVRAGRESSHAGFEAGGDVIYSLTPKFGIGIGGAKVSTGKRLSEIVFGSAGLFEDSVRIRPRVSVTAFRAGLYYTFPFSGRLGISFHGGPALYSAEYSFSVGGSGSFIRQGHVFTGYFQNATAKQMGFEGGLGFELNANPFVAIFAEVQGRYAKIGGFEGDESGQFFENNQLHNLANSGPVYFAQTGPYPDLEVGLSQGASSARRANLNFSGFSLLAGLKLRL